MIYLNLVKFLFLSTKKVGPRFETQTEMKLVGPDYGVIVSAIDSSNDQKVAIRKLSIRGHVSCERALREVTLLKKLNHPNLTNLIDLIINFEAKNVTVNFCSNIIKYFGGIHF